MSSHGRLAGEVVAFAGRLQTFSRREVEAVVQAQGGRVARRLTGHTSLLVVGQAGWKGLPRGAVPAPVRRAETRGVPILSERAFRERVGLQPPESHAGAYPPEALCALAGLEPEHLRRLEMFGILHPRHGRYDFRDLVAARQALQLLSAGVSAEAIARSLSRLGRRWPQAEPSLSQLHLVAERSGELVVDREGARMTPEGQYLLDLPRSSEPEGAQWWFEAGYLAEMAEDLSAAEDAYGRSLSLEPEAPWVHFNLGNVRRDRGDPAGAEAAYREALRIDTGLVEVWFNLADILEAQGRSREAQQCLWRCLWIDPDWADAHFNLAGLHERQARPHAARRHWRRYVELDPVGPWAEVARWRLRRLQRRPPGGQA